jgi:hypothetical protein
MDRTVAGGIHGDGAPTNKIDGLFTISWSSQTAVGPTIKTKLIFTVVRKSDMEDGTLEKLFDYLAWAMNALLENRYPARDWLGNPHPKAGQTINEDGYNLACNQLRGDWEFYTQVLNFPRWDSEPNMCFVCDASNSVLDLLWTNGSAGAGWRPTIRTHEQYVAMLALLGKLLPALFKIRALRLEGVMIDILHALDQGVSCHVVANIFIEVSLVSLLGFFRPLSYYCLGVFHDSARGPQASPVWKQPVGSNQASLANSLKPPPPTKLA